jgi:hypothetical protein
VRGRLRTWLLCGSLVIGALASVVFMRPTLVAPVAGDDRAFMPTIAAHPWTLLSELRDLPEVWEQKSQTGRVTILALLERRAAARWVVEAAVRTDTRIALVLGALKLLLTVASVLTLTALVKSLRWRRSDGVLLRASRQTVILCTLAGGVLFALGSQSQFLERNGRNGWVSYPTLTYGAVVSIFGVVALVLWLTRLYAERRYRVLTIVALVLLAVVTNFRYELTFVAVPLSVIALVLVPLTPDDRAADGRRAKWVTGLAYGGVFLLIFVAMRVYLRSQCAEGGCYEGVTLRLSTDIARTFWFNVVSSVPGAGASKASEYVTWSGTSTEGMFAPTPASIIVAGGMALALALCWWSTRPAAPTSPSAASQPQDAEISCGREEAQLLTIGAALCLLGSLGAAAVMSLSKAPQQGITEVGLLYRHTVVSWAGMAWAIVLGVTALGRWRPRTGAAAWLVLTLATAVLAAVLMPANERSLTADRTVNSATTSAFAALVRGDVSSTANAHRCRLVPEIYRERGREPGIVGGGMRTVQAFDQAFLRYWGRGFCQP